MPSALDDILIIAPYNAQVFELQDRIPGARIGTVDKFQGQEAPIVIYSMTTSTHADAPRGMNFLYSLNRLNVATSRARCLSILVVLAGAFRAGVPHAGADADGECVLPLFGDGEQTYVKVGLAEQPGLPVRLGLLLIALGDVDHLLLQNV